MEAQGREAVAAVDRGSGWGEDWSGNDLQSRVVIFAMVFKRDVGGRGDFWAERRACVKAGRCPTHSVA